jgi:hypothetical protein
MMILEWGGVPQYINWDNCPKYRTIKLSELIDQKDNVLKSKMYLKVHLDIDISFEEANFIKETFTNDYDIREISLIQDKVNLESGVEDRLDSAFESINQIVSEQLINIDSTQFNKKLLLDIYNNL